jgi:5'-3' exonuclease
MGIPGFFKLIRKYNVIYDHEGNEVSRGMGGNIIKISIPEEHNGVATKQHLFLDFNGGIYTAYHKNNVKTEEALIVNVLGYLDTLVSIYPELKTLYLAIDGVPPRAKIEQQRTRRFHSTDEKNTIIKLNQKYGEAVDKAVPENQIDTNMITPGTEFMDNLHKKLLHHFKTSPLYKNIHVIYSGYNVPLEGEHKILQYIKQRQWEPEDQVIIYGLDADLIMLSMASQINNIYLLREKTEYGNYSFDCEGHQFLYLDIDGVKSCVINDFEDFLGDIEMAEIPRFIDDYIFLCFILGNDFIPHIPWLNIKNNGHDTILDAYFQVYNLYREFLVDSENGKINHMLLFYLFDKLQEREDEEMVSYHKSRKKQRVRFHDTHTELERKIKVMQFYPLRHLDIEEKIEPTREGWRYRYYKTCMNITATEENRDMVVQRYLESLVWTFRYYFKEIDSWSWFYPYHYGPTCKDICNFMNKMNTKDGFNGVKHVNQIKFFKSKPIKPQELLVMVLPYGSRRFMIANIQNQLIDPKSPISVYFPKKYQMSIPYHTFYWQCRPILPIINCKTVVDTVKKTKMTKVEQNRNKLGTVYDSANQN